MKTLRESHPGHPEIPEGFGRGARVRFAVTKDIRGLAMWENGIRRCLLEEADSVRGVIGEVKCVGFSVIYSDIKYRFPLPGHPNYCAVQWTEPGFPQLVAAAKPDEACYTCAGGDCDQCAEEDCNEKPVKEEPLTDAEPQQTDLPFPPTEEAPRYAIRGRCSCDPKRKYYYGCECGGGR